MDALVYKHWHTMVSPLLLRLNMMQNLYNIGGSSDREVRHHHGFSFWGGHPQTPSVHQTMYVAYLYGT